MITGQQCYGHCSLVTFIGGDIMENKCPNCECEIIRDGTVKYDGDLVGYPFECECGFKGTEWYRWIGWRSPCTQK